MYKAEMVLDSISSVPGLQRHRITTMLVTMPRIILAEFNTHRMLSRNSASSRAIPFKKMVEAINTNPFIPLRWMKDHSGMQGTEYLEDRLVKYAERDWLKSRDLAVEQASKFHANDITKQICNRLLEPFMWHTVLVTATDWENFFALRDDPAAEIHMQHVAHLMLECMNNSTPQVLKADEWHIPFGNNVPFEDLQNIVTDNGTRLYFRDPWEERERALLKISTARCAQTSYTIVGEDGKPMDYLKLIKLHDRLANAGHWSPFEHCARVMRADQYEGGLCDVKFVGSDEGGNAIYEYGWCGNFRGFIQYRKMFQNENRKDPRLINKLTQ